MNINTNEDINEKAGTYIFHVHTWRCGHAADIPDEEYVKAALDKGAESITFTDHAPFPGDPFRNRMGMDQLDEYLRTLTDLKEKYSGEITVRVGLEVEYMPSFMDYYDELKANPLIDLLIMGEHIFEYGDGTYSFEKKSKELEFLRNQVLKFLAFQIEGVKSNLFSVVAHPDRCLRRLKEWDDSLNSSVAELATAAKERSIALEINAESFRRKKQFWPEFWALVPENVKKVYGCDAHSVEELKTDDEVRSLAERILGGSNGRE